MTISSNPFVQNLFGTANSPTNSTHCASSGTSTTAKLHGELQQVQAQTPQEFQAMLSQLTGQMTQNQGSQSQQGILSWL